MIFVFAFGFVLILMFITISIFILIFICICVHLYVFTCIEGCLDHVAMDWDLYEAQYEVDLYGWRPGNLAELPADFHNTAATVRAPSWTDAHYLRRGCWCAWWAFSSLEPDRSATAKEHTTADTCHPQA